MDIDRLAEPLGYWLALSGALAIGAGLGTGVGRWMVARRFGCLAGGGTHPVAADVVNASAACADTLGALSSITWVATLGGVVAFACGVVAAVYGRRHRQP